MPKENKNPHQVEGFSFFFPSFHSPEEKRRKNIESQKKKSVGRMYKKPFEKHPRCKKKRLFIIQSWLFLPAHFIFPISTFDSPVRFPPLDPALPRNQALWTLRFRLR